MKSVHIKLSFFAFNVQTEKAEKRKELKRKGEEIKER
jgi:hypothetical protein